MSVFITMFTDKKIKKVTIDFCLTFVGKNKIYKLVIFASICLVANKTACSVDYLYFCSYTLTLRSHDFVLVFFFMSKFINKQIFVISLNIFVSAFTD